MRLRTSRPQDVAIEADVDGASAGGLAMPGAVSLPVGGSLCWRRTRSSRPEAEPHDPRFRRLARQTAASSPTTRRVAASFDGRLLPPVAAKLRDQFPSQARYVIDPMASRRERDATES